MDIKDKIKCGTYTVGFDDVPNHVSLILSITNCTGTCEGCHSSWLRDDVGEVLEDNIIPIVNRYKDYINCICFMGEGNQLQENNLIKCFNIIKEYFPELKIALFSGKNKINEKFEQYLDFYKIGPYISQFGPLTNPNTNQILYTKRNGEWIDVTKRYWTKEI